MGSEGGGGWGGYSRNTTPCDLWHFLYFNLNGGHLLASGCSLSSCDNYNLSCCIWNVQAETDAPMYFNRTAKPTRDLFDVRFGQSSSVIRPQLFVYRRLNRSEAMFVYRRLNRSEAIFVYRRLNRSEAMAVAMTLSGFESFRSSRINQAWGPKQRTIPQSVTASSEQTVHSHAHTALFFFFFFIHWSRKYPSHHSNFRMREGTRTRKL